MLPGIAFYHFLYDIFGIEFDFLTGLANYIYCCKILGVCYNSCAEHTIISKKECKL